MNLSKARLSEDQLIAAYEHNNPADGHAIGCKEVAQAQLKACEEEVDRQIANEMLKEIGENCYTLWADVDEEFTEHICINRGWLQALKAKAEEVKHGS